MGVFGGSEKNAGTGLVKPRVESLTPKAEFIGDIASASALNLYQVNGIDLKLFRIKATWKSSL